MSVHVSDDELYQHPDEETVRYFDFSDHLAAGDTIATVATPVEQDTSDLTLSGEAKIASDTATYRIVNGRRVDHTVPANKGVQVTISGGVHNRNYWIQCEVTTTNGETLIIVGPLLVRKR